MQNFHYLVQNSVNLSSVNWGKFVIGLGCDLGFCVYLSLVVVSLVFGSSAVVSLETLVSAGCRVAC